MSHLCPQGHFCYSKGNIGNMKGHIADTKGTSVPLNYIVWIIRKWWVSRSAPFHLLPYGPLTIHYLLNASYNGTSSA